MSGAAFDLDAILADLREGKRLDERVLVALFLKLMETLQDEQNVLYLTSPMIICGDIHGQLYDLFQLFRTVGVEGVDIGDRKFLFMGDYVDRGYYSIETFSYLAALKLKHPGQISLLRGNHECRAVNQMYGFFTESVYYYGHPGIWSMANDLFDMLPLAACVDNRVFSVHGGLSPSIGLIQKISTLQTNMELPESGPLCDLAWSDPEAIEGWQLNPRGAGYLFGTEPTRKFTHINSLEFVTRSHQIAMDGYQWWFNDKLVCVWSAPNYMYRSQNKASVMVYSGMGSHEMKVFDQMPDSERKKPEDPVPQNYFA